MSELLLFAYDHTLDVGTTVEQRCSLPSLYDLSVTNIDGWGWGDQELTHPWFRILAWPQADPSEIEVLLSNLLPEMDSSDPPNPTTLWQYRGYYLNIVDTTFQDISGFTSYWQDNGRATPIFIIPASFINTVASLTVSRPVIPVSG